MENVVRKVAIVAIIVLSIMLAMRSEANDAIQLDEASVTYKSFFPGGFDPMITDAGLPNRTLGKGLDLNLNTNIFTVFYFNSLVHSMTDQVVNTGGKGQFRTVGLQMELGVKLSNSIDLFYLHHSQHVLDHEAPFHFPVQDSVGVRIILFKQNHRESLLQ